MEKSHERALLVLEDGTTFLGHAWGSKGQTLGEIVFSTAMTGYQETLTDPSYCGQILVMTAPHIGNTGMNTEDEESSNIWVAGLVARDPARRASNWRSERTLEHDLVEQGTVGICDVDTRAITRHIRTCGAMKAGIFSGEALPGNIGTHVPTQVTDHLLELVRSQEQMSGLNLADKVSTTDMYTVHAHELQNGSSLSERETTFRVVALDLGIKANSIRLLNKRGCDVVVMPSQATLEDILAQRPDGVFFSNGPGDPESAGAQVDVLRGLLDQKVPFFGICFGHQLFGRALGLSTYKLPFGHRGVNQPVCDRGTGRVEITAHNHGFAVDAPVDATFVAPYDDGKYGKIQVSHVCLNDGVIEGLEAIDIPAFSVQFHPEAAAGPHDGEHLFDRFILLIAAFRKEN